MDFKVEGIRCERNDVGNYKGVIRMKYINKDNQEGDLYIDVPNFTFVDEKHLIAFPADDEEQNNDCVEIEIDIP